MFRRREGRFKRADVAKADEKRATAAVMRPYPSGFEVLVQLSRSEKRKRRTECRDLDNTWAAFAGASFGSD